MKLAASLLVSALAFLAASSPFEPRSLQKRGLEKCKTLSAESNDGGRKVAIVVDESGSMLLSDPYNLRIAAAKLINDWLITSGEAGDGKKADLVTLIGFDDTTRLYYSLGDPSGATDKVFDQITSYGGTYIGLGVDAAMAQLNASGHDPTANRSTIIVLTDGADSDTAALVDSIDNAGRQGVRVSFGFLQDFGYSYQDPDVLLSIKATHGTYATIDGANAQNAFVNYMIANGLTDNDKTSTNTSTTVYNGLSVAFVMDGSGSQTLTYTAQKKEDLTFSISSVSAGELNITATDSSGKELGKANVEELSYSPEDVVITAPSDGTLNLLIQGDPNQSNAIFIVGANSSIPLTNCTLGNPKNEGLSTGAKAGLGVGIPVLAGVLGLGGYLLWKYFKGPMPKMAVPPKFFSPKYWSSPITSPPPPPPGGHAPPMDYKTPHIQTDPVHTPMTPMAPGNGPPGWAMPPPMKPPTNPKKPGGDGDPNNDQPDYFNNQPANQQPFNPQGDPSHPSQPDGHYPNQPDPSHPTQADPSHPSHPTQADPYHPTQADPSHPTQADPSHPTQADPSHPTQADPNHPTQADPNHPTQADPNPNQPTDPNQNPSDPHPHRLPTPRWFPRALGRRRKKDEEEEQNQHGQVGTVQHPDLTSTTSSSSFHQSHNQSEYVSSSSYQYSSSGTVVAPPSSGGVSPPQQHAVPARQYTTPAQEVHGNNTYKVSPVQQHAELATTATMRTVSSSSNVQQQQQYHNNDIISPVLTGYGSAPRRQ